MECKLNVTKEESTAVPTRMAHGECRTMQNDKMRSDSKPRLVFVISLLLCLGSKYHRGVQSFVLNREVVNTVRFYNNDALHAASKQPWQQTECRTSRIESTRLHSISEWRDKMFDYLPGSSTDRRLGSELAIAPPKEICVLPFPFQDVLVQGETKQLRLYEDRFIKLFEYCIEHHHGVVAMGLVADSGIVQTVPICEMESFTNNMGKDLGVFVTLRVVGRAKLIDIFQQEPYIKAICEEIIDTIPPNLELPNLVASNIENLILLLTSMEHRLENAQKNEIMKKDAINEEGPNDIEMKRRIQLAKLEDTFYDDDEDDEEWSEDDDEEKSIDRLKRFRRACEIALSTDTQGYQVVTPQQQSTVDDAGRKQRNDKYKDDLSSLRDARELTAISWAAHCTDLLHDIESVTYRIQALDCSILFDRLNIGFHMLRKKKEAVQRKLQQAGLMLKREDDYFSGGDDDSRNGNNATDATSDGNSNKQ